MFTSPALKKRHYAPFVALLMFGVFSVALGVNMSLKDAFSATGSIYIESPKTAIKGKTIDIPIRINPGGAHVDTVTATIGFDNTKFAYSTVSFTGSPFTTQLPIKATDHDVTVVSSILGGSTVDTDSLIAVVSFTPRVYTTTFDANFSLSGNAAFAGTATDPATTNNTFAFTQPSVTNIPTNPIDSIISPTKQPSDSKQTPSDSPLATLTPADGAAVYNGAQILLKTSSLAAQVRNVTPAAYVLISAGFILMCITIALFMRYKKRHEAFIDLQAHMNLVRDPSSLVTLQ